MNGVHVGISIVRIIVGVIFFSHGLAKFQNGIGNSITYFESIGISGEMAVIVAVVELGAGAALIVGFATRIAALLLIPVMVGAIFFVHWPEGLIRSAAGPGYELNLLLLAVCLHLGLTGSKLFALDSYVMNSKGDGSIKLGKWLMEKK
ncbi:MAG: DoxX family protein [Bacillus sp. (in: Bacteria)]|nr:DoxX family protein [Bacillus sp. (in: firmicutes)]